MEEPKVTEEITYSTVETSKSTTTNQKRILRNTWKGNAVQVNSYDAEGRLQSCETDKETYQDLDAEHYHWKDTDTPPDIPLPDYATQVEPFGANSLQTTTQIASNGSVLTLASTEMSSTPVVHWTGESTQHFTSGPTHINANGPSKLQSGTQNDEAIARAQVPLHIDSEIPSTGGDVVVSRSAEPREMKRDTEIKLKETLDGSKWSRTVETVWMSSNKPTNTNLAITCGTHEAAVGAVSVEGGANGGGKGAEKGAPKENGAPALSVEERRKMRRCAARELAEKKGVKKN